MDLEVIGNIKVRDNTNLSSPITRYKITYLIWDLETRNICIRVEYYNKENLSFTKDFCYEGSDDVDVNKLIDKVKSQH